MQQVDAPDLVGKLQIFASDLGRQSQAKFRCNRQQRDTEFAFSRISLVNKSPSHRAFELTRDSDALGVNFMPPNAQTQAFLLCYQCRRAIYIANSNHAQS